MTDLTTVNTTAIQAQDIEQDLYKKWTEYLDTAAKTTETYTKNIKQFFAYLAGNGITRPVREDVIAYRDSLIAAGKKPATVQGYLMAVKLFFQWTAQEGLYPDIAQHVKGAKIDTEHKKDPLTAAQVSALLQSIDRTTLQGKRDYAIIALMTTAGLRTIEVSRANIEDVRTTTGYAALFIQGKGHNEKAAHVKLAAPVEEAIRDYLKARQETKPASPLFASIANRDAGERLSTRSISRIVKDNLKNIGLNSDRLTAHSLRHTAATLNLLAGGTVEETQQLLRHRNINTTLIYSHALERANNNSELRIAEAIF